MIQDARLKFDSGDPYWAADLMVKLEEHRRGRSLEWLLHCIRELLSHIPDEDRPECELLCNEFALLIKQAPAPTEVFAKGQSIWCAKRDILHTALGHLFAALAYYLSNDDRGYRTTIVRVARIIGGHQLYRNEHVETPLRLFELTLKAPSSFE